MPLPELIELVPLSREQLEGLKGRKARIGIPGSKSITNRAIVLAALANGSVTLHGALWSEDTAAMTICMRRLGIDVRIERDARLSANRIITVHGHGGAIPAGGTEAAPLELHVANAGTAARFLTAMVCLGSGVYRLSGTDRMHERPQHYLFRALRHLGYRIETPNERLPALIYGGGVRRGSVTRSVTVSVSESSQFASALLLCARAGGWRVSTSGGGELPYVEMTKRMLEEWASGGAQGGRQGGREGGLFDKGGRYEIEADASSASYFHAINLLFPGARPVQLIGAPPPRAHGGSGLQAESLSLSLTPMFL